MYKFNPQHIADLSGGKVILEHTKKEEDLPLIRAVLKDAFPKEYKSPAGDCDYYCLFTDNTWLGSDDLPHLPIMHLHDFLAKDELPKEDLSRIDLMDKRLKELEDVISQDRIEMLSYISEVGTSQRLAALLGGEMKQSPLQRTEVVENPKNGLSKYAQEQINALTGKWQVNVQTFNEFRDDYKIVAYPRNGFLETKTTAYKIADLIRWVLDNQETVLKLKNNE
jgi:hypothetical protein